MIVRGEYPGEAEAILADWTLYNLALYRLAEERIGTAQRAEQAREDAAVSAAKKAASGPPRRRRA